MEFQSLCSKLKEQLAVELRGASDPEQRDDLLIEGLYQVSRAVLSRLGPPQKTDEYLEKQEAVLDLITFLAIPLIQGGTARRGVSVLSEIGEGCPDPLLKKKLTVYSRQLLARIEQGAGVDSPPPRRLMSAAVISSLLALWAVYLAWPSLQGPRGRSAHDPQHANRWASSAPASLDNGPAAGMPMLEPSVASPQARERRGQEGISPDRQPAEGRGGGDPAEVVTRVRIINDQVLVPVTLKCGAESVKAELVMDTGATRTAIHEGLVGKLRVDLESARSGQAELADGRVISSRIVKIDSLVAGPFTMAGADVEVIPYRRGDGIHDGLLGMDFLGKHRFQVDIEHRLIRWY